MHSSPSRILLLLFLVLVFPAAPAAATCTSQTSHGAHVRPVDSPVSPRHGTACCAAAAARPGGRRRHHPASDASFSAGRHAAARAIVSSAIFEAGALRTPPAAQLSPMPALSRRRIAGRTAFITAERSAAESTLTPTKCATSTLSGHTISTAVTTTREARCLQLPAPSAASVAVLSAPAGAAVFSEASVAHVDTPATPPPASKASITTSAARKARGALPAATGALPPALAVPAVAPAEAAGVVVAALAPRPADAPGWPATMRAASGSVVLATRCVPVGGLAAVTENVRIPAGMAGEGLAATPSSVAAFLRQDAALPRVVSSAQTTAPRATDTGKTAARRGGTAGAAHRATAAALRGAAAAAALRRLETALSGTTWRASTASERAGAIVPQATAVHPPAAAALTAAGGRRASNFLYARLRRRFLRPSAAAFAVTTRLKVNPLLGSNGSTGRPPENMGEQGSPSASVAAAPGGRPPAAWIEDYWTERSSAFAGRRVLTGLQPSGNLHLGNWFSTFHPLRLLAEAGAETAVLLGDIHATFNSSLCRGSTLLPEWPQQQQQQRCPRALGRQEQRTEPESATVHEAAATSGYSLEDASIDLVAWALAAGLQPVGQQATEKHTAERQSKAQHRGKTVIALQSLLPEHAVLAALLMGSTPLTCLNRCKTASANINRLENLQQSLVTKHQQHLHRQQTSQLQASALPDWEASPGSVEMEREDLSASQQFASVGMRFYPLLMAADILAQDADYVLVGDDQQQHIEFTRQVARRWNLRFSRESTVLASADVGGPPAAGGAPRVSTPASTGSPASAACLPASAAIPSATRSPPSAGYPAGDASSAALPAASRCAVAAALQPLSGAPAPSASAVVSAAADLPLELLRPPTRLGSWRVCGRLGDLGDASVKMSKSSSSPFRNIKYGGSTRLRAKGCIFLSDPPDIIAAKIAAAKTDNEHGVSYYSTLETAACTSHGRQRGDGSACSDISAAAERTTRPECNNLVHLWCATTGDSPAAAAARFQHTSWKTFKSELTACLIDYLLPLQRNYEELRGDTAVLKAVLVEGSRVARARAAKTVQRVKDSMHFLSV